MIDWDPNVNLDPDPSTVDPSVYDPPHSKMSLMFYVPGPFTQISTATFKSNIMLHLSHDSKDCTCVTIPLRGGTAPLDGGVLPLLLSSPTVCNPESSLLVPNESIPIDVFGLVWTEGAETPLDA